MGKPCPGLEMFTDPRDGQVYPTVQIGDQCWIQKNLNYQTEENECIDPWDTALCEIYGQEYTWKDAMQEAYQNEVIVSIQGVCPPGWHIPSKVEWEKLIDYLGGDTIASKQMKSQSGGGDDGYYGNNKSGIN